MATEFEADRSRNGISKGTTPDGKPGHTPTATERMGLMYRAGQDPASPNIDFSPDPCYFNGEEPLPKGLKKPKYADKRPGGFVDKH